MAEDQPSLKNAQPAGFPNCGICPFLKTGSAAVCYACASATIRRAKEPCDICGQENGSEDRCRNRLCTDPDRSISAIRAIAMKEDAVDRTIKRLKYQRRTGWATIFGRLVYGYIDGHAADHVGLILANPTYVDPTLPEWQQRVRHTELVIDAAAREDVLDKWPWDTADPRALIKLGSTPRSANSGRAAKLEAADALAKSLCITDPARISGKAIIVYDDVCTTGLQLDRVARVLKEGGAETVVGLVLARQPWR